MQRIVQGSDASQIIDNSAKKHKKNLYVDRKKTKFKKKL